MGVLDTAILFAYLALMVAIGIYANRRQKDVDDYFVAGRNASSVIVGISMIATLFSTISFLGTPGELITYGPGLAWAREAAATVGRQALHARALEFDHPTTGERLEVESPLPADLDELRAILRRHPA